MIIIFYIAAAVAVISTFMVITRRNPVHALLYLVVSLLSVAVIFFIIGAPFIAALEVVVYAGAIMVLFIFVIMILNLGSQENIKKNQWLNGKVWVGPAVLTLILLAGFIYLIAVSGEGMIGNKMVVPKDVGLSLFGKYMLGVELSAMLLLSGIIGAYHIGRGKKKIKHRFLVKEENQNE